MYGQTTGDGALALRRLASAYPMAMAYLDRAYRAGGADGTCAPTGAGSSASGARRPAGPPSKSAGRRRPEAATDATPWSRGPRPSCSSSGR